MVFIVEMNTASQVQGWTRLFVFPMVLMPLEKVSIQLFSL